MSKRRLGGFSACIMTMLKQMQCKSMGRTCLMTLVLFAVLLFCLGSACADEVNPLRVSMQVSQTAFTEPADITVSIRVANTGEETLPGAVTLFYPDGTQVEEFGAPILEGGASKSWTGNISVTQAMLDAGKITFRIRYSLYNEDGDLVSKSRNFSKEISYTGGVVSLDVSRTITPAMASKGQEVSIRYDIVNTGTLEATDISLSESAAVSSVRGSIASIAPGEKGSYTFTATMGSKDMTSQATITYKAGGRTETILKEPATIKYGEIRLKSTISSDKKGGVPGDTVKLTLKLANSAKTDYTNITVTDPVLGLLFTNVTATAGKTTTLEKEVVIDTTTNYQFSITATDGEGNEIETASNLLTVTAVSPEQVISLSVVAEADRSIIYTVPGTVRFTVSVTNESTVDVTDVRVTSSGVTLYTFPSIYSGETRTFTRDVSVSMKGTFQFEASTLNQLQERVSFSSNTLKIDSASPTEVPTEVPIVTPPKPELQNLPTEDDLNETVKALQQPLMTVGIVFVSLFALGFILLCAAALRRRKLKLESAAALDHLSGGGSRDYTAPGGNFMPQEEPEETPDDNSGLFPEITTEDTSYYTSQMPDAPDKKEDDGDRPDPDDIQP